MNNYIYAFFLSMIPVNELRGTIIWAATQDMQPWITYIVCVIGNLLPVPFLIVFGRRVLEWFSKPEKLGKPFRAIMRLGEKKVAKMTKALFWGLFLFVAIPLPGTGAWTGSLIAITLNLNIKKAFPPIVLGVITAGLIMTLGSLGVVEIFKVFTN